MRDRQANLYAGAVYLVATKAGTVKDESIMGPFQDT